MDDGDPSNALLAVRLTRAVVGYDGLDAEPPQGLAQTSYRVGDATVAVPRTRMEIDDPQPWTPAISSAITAISRRRATRTSGEGTTLPVRDASPRVAIVQQALRQYRAGFYTALRDQLAKDGIELLLFHSTPAPEDDARDDPLDVPWAEYLPIRHFGVRGPFLLWQKYSVELRRAEFVIVEQASSLALNYRLLWRQRRGLVRLAFWGHGRDFSANPGSWSERLKAIVSAHAHWWFAYNDLAAEIVVGLGVPPERVTVVDNTIDASALADDLDRVVHDSGAALRRRLELGEGPIGLFLGTLRADKRLDVLFDAADQIHTARPDFRLLLVGAGPLSDEVRRHADTRPWMHHLGSLYGSDRAQVLALADVMLVPAWVGLVVVDAFVSGVPLVTSVEGPHPPEIRYVADGYNGLMVPDGLNPAIYAAAVLDLLNDGEQRARLVAGCKEVAPHYSIEAMAGRFASGIRQALDVPLETKRVR